jgi:hypothetical protein
MGYGNYVGKLKKGLNWNTTMEELICFCKKEENDNEIDWVSPYVLVEKLHEFGENVNIKKLEGNLKHYFNQSEVKKHFESDYEFMQIKKEGLKAIIEEYSEYIANYYEGLLKKDEFEDETIEQKCVVAIKSKLRAWKKNYCIPYNLDENKDSLVSSWEYEHSIFDLVRIYKTFDWEKETMIWYGY